MVQNFTIVADGKNRLEVLSRITAVLLQEQIPVEKLFFDSSGNGVGRIKIFCQTEREDILKRAVNQIGSMVDIFQAYYIEDKKR